MSEPKTHECTFPEVGQHPGRKLLGPCTACGLPAAAALALLRGDAIREVVVEFLNERPTYSAAGLGALNTGDSDRWAGHVDARNMLEQRLDGAGVDPTAAPQLVDDRLSRPAPRNAKLVRDLHILEVIDVAGNRFSSCKADGYISADLAADPCPTLWALDQTDPPPLLDADKIATAIHNALNSALCNGGTGIPGWSLTEEAQRAAEAITVGLPVVDLSSEAAVRKVVDAITSPGRFTSRDGDAVPGHQARAVLQVLRGKP